VVHSQIPVTHEFVEDLCDNENQMCIGHKRPWARPARVDGMPSNLVPLTGNWRRRVHAAPSRVFREHSSRLVHFLALVGITESHLQVHQQLLVELKNLTGRFAHQFAVCSVFWKDCQVNLDSPVLESSTEVSVNTYTDESIQIPDVAFLG
jgi:hypothetical protein